MARLSRGIEIPETHIREGRARPASLPSEGDDLARRTVMHVHTSPERPVDAFVPVWFQDHWFYIRHADQQSKQAFTLLTYIFQMQAVPEAPSAAPVVTVPTG